MDTGLGMSLTDGSLVSTAGSILDRVFTQDFKAFFSLETALGDIIIFCSTFVDQVVVKIMKVRHKIEPTSISPFSGKRGCPGQPARLACIKNITKIEELAIMQINILLLLVISLCISLLDAKKMWGSRKKRDDGDSGIVAPPRTVPKPSSSRATANTRKLSMDEIGESFDAGSLNEMFTKYLDTFEESLDTIDFTSLVNPEQIRQLIAHVPGAAESPEVSAMLSILETSDAETLRNLAREGVSTMRGAMDEVIDFLTSPEKIAQLLSQLPPEVREVVKALQTGDTTLLKNIIINQPGK